MIGRAGETVGPPELLGATPHADASTYFLVWAPNAERVVVHLPGSKIVPTDRDVELVATSDGYHRGAIENVVAGQRYGFCLDGSDPLPDPASRLQPEGVHGLSAVYDPTFARAESDWRGVGIRGRIIYETHIGTFTPEGTFDAAADQLDRLVDVGVDTIELLPIGEFPGTRNWGYDEVLKYAPHHSYGGPEGLARFVDACHRRHIAVILDVVYNHLGPEGNRLQEFGPYFTDVYSTPWGDALNFSEAGSDHVRRYFVENARRWVSEFHIDGFRLDAVHAIVDPTARPFVEELTDAIHAEADALGRRALVIAESSANDPRLIREADRGGYGMDGVWNDDFHHALHTLLTDEHRGYYVDYDGVTDLATAYRDGFVLTGRHSEFRGRRHGRSAGDIPPERFVVFAQNHDQVGNRVIGRRLTSLVAPERVRFAAAATLLSPFTPLLFMGEEYGETRPFPYFVSHTDDHLVAAVREGRAREFADFQIEGEPPDPHSEDTFRSAILDPSVGDPTLIALHRRLAELRRQVPVLTDPHAATSVSVLGSTLTLARRSARDEARVVLHASDQPSALTLGSDDWDVLLDTGSFPGDPPGVQNSALELAPWSATLVVRR